MKKVLAMILSLTLVVTLTIGGSIAYLTSEDSDVNVMTLGNVQIEQHEQERVKNDEGNKTVDLQEFSQGQTMMPVVGNTSSKTAITINGYGLEMRSNDVKNYIDKIITVENTGKSDAYVRTIYAFPEVKGAGTDANAFNTTYNASEQWFHWNGVSDTDTTENNGWMWGRYAGEKGADTKEWPANTDNWDVVENVTIKVDGVEGTYDLYIVTNKNPIEAGEKTAPSLLGYFIDSRVDNEVDANGNVYYTFTDKNNKEWNLGDISKLNVLVATQAVQADGFADAWTALDTAFGDITADDHPWSEGVSEDKLPILVSNAEELFETLTANTDARSGDVTIHITKDIAMGDFEWTPVKVDGYHGAGVITVEGNGHKITGLKAPLFAGGFAGKSGIIIKNLTIADSNIESTNKTGSGAFIESVDSMQTITLENCHLKNSTVKGGSGSRTGGLIGWTAGYDNVNDGPVKTYVTIKNCSVVGCKISCDGSVGGIYGHAGNNAWTYSTVENCTVKNNQLTSYDDSYRVGVVVGTANVGELTISGITNEGNTLKQINGETEISRPEGQSELYGRFVPGETGKLTIDGAAINK